MNWRWRNSIAQGRVLVYSRTGHARASVSWPSSTVLKCCVGKEKEKEKKRRSFITRVRVSAFSSDAYARSSWVQPFLFRLGWHHCACERRSNLVTAPLSRSSFNQEMNPRTQIIFHPFATPQVYRTINQCHILGGDTEAETDETLCEEGCKERKRIYLCVYACIYKCVSEAMTRKKRMSVVN